MTEWNEKAVFLSVLALSKEDREAFIQSACPDEASRERIRSLIRHHDDASDDFLSAKTQTASDLPGPRQIEEFRIIHRLGEGGMGVVYLAEDTILGRRVALKVLAKQMTGSEQALARFREEARSAAALKHPAIVPVFKFGRDGENYYIASELVEGPTLAHLIADKRSAAGLAGTRDEKDWHRQAAEIMATIAEALECAHQAGIVHRDVKPSNILLDRERGPRLTDFGIAKHLTEENRNTHTGVIGTCHYMSPEQAAVADTRVDQRSDIFSLGVVLYEMLALRLPFDGPTMQQILQAVMYSEPVRLRTINRRLATDLETICHKALEKLPRDRYQTAAHVSADLRCFLRGDPILATPPSLPRRARRWVLQHRKASISSVAAVLILMIGLLAWRLRMAADASLVWFSVESDTPGATTYLQRVNPSTGEVASLAESLGSTPIHNWSVPTGQYRITVVSPGTEAFAEFNLLAVEAGRSNGKELRVHDSASFSAQQPSNPKGVLHAVLRRTSDVRADMISIDGGDYICGRKGSEPPLFVERHVGLSEFLIDKHEVSNREFKEFADATGRAYPKYWMRSGFDEALANHPVVAMTWEDCEAYARWRGKRLPTHLEWQAAARGHSGRLYPWGDSTDNAPSEFAAYAVDLSQQQSRDENTRVDLYRRYMKPVDVIDALGNSADLSQVFGNVREITATVDMTRRDYIIMGRCWADIPRHTTLADVWSLPIDAVLDKHGFRCAKSVALPSVTK